MRLDMNQKVLDMNVIMDIRESEIMWVVKWYDTLKDINMIRGEI